MQNVQNAPRQPPVAGEVLSPLPHPRLTPKKPYLPAAVASVRRFRGQLATERIVAVYRPSLLFALGPSIPVAIGLFGLVLWHRATNPGQAATFLTSLVLVLISAPLAFRFVFTWLGRLYILTDERVL